ncbi:hypothetical protein [Leekyejoonella antrihumi]|nr:hypothetical protein [Leekyejoonella antrihumi]
MTLAWIIALVVAYLLGCCVLAVVLGRAIRRHTHRTEDPSDQDHHPHT